MKVRGGDARFCQGKGRPALVCLDKDQGLKQMGVPAGRWLEGYVWGRWRPAQQMGEAVKRGRPKFKPRGGGAPLLEIGFALGLGFFFLFF